MPRYLLIVNPTSGRGFAGRSLPVIEQEMKKCGLEYTLVQTERPWHAADLAEQGARDGYDVVVIASGDGTANEVLNGLRRVARFWPKIIDGQWMWVSLKAAITRMDVSSATGLGLVSMLPQASWRPESVGYVACCST